MRESSFGDIKLVKRIGEKSRSSFYDVEMFRHLPFAKKILAKTY